MHGALALAGGRIVEMQTGEGKTLAAVPAVVWFARSRRRRARAHRQRLPRAARRRLDARDLRVVRSVGRRDPARHGPARAPGGVPLRRHLRDGERSRASTTCATGWRCRRTSRCIGRSPPPSIDEADSILIDEARIPLVIAGGAADAPGPAARADRVVRALAAASTSRSSLPAETSRSRRRASSTWSAPSARRNLFESENSRRS